MMRPTKHVTDPSFRTSQEVFEIAIARLDYQGQTLPVVATSEAESITVFVWDDGTGRWRNVRITHAPIEVARGTPSISNTWNWSRRLGLPYHVKRADLRGLQTVSWGTGWGETFACSVDACHH